MTTRRIAGLAALGLTIAFGPAWAEGPATRQDETETRPQEEGREQDRGIARLDAIRRAGRLIGAEVGGAGGDEGIARVRDLIWDGHGRPLYFLLSPGLGDAGTAFIPMPARVTKLTRVEDEAWLVQLDAEGDQVDAVPKIGADEVHTLLDHGRRAAIEAQFSPEDPPSPIVAGDDPDPALIRASELLGLTVLGEGGPVGRIEDILTGNEHQASYLVLGVEGDPSRLVPVPYSAITIRRDDTGAISAVMEVDRERLALAPSLEGDWHKMLNTSFVEAVYNVHSKRDGDREP